MSHLQGWGSLIYPSFHRFSVTLPASLNMLHVPLASFIAWEMTRLQSWSAWWTVLAAQIARSASYPGGPTERKNTGKHVKFDLNCHELLKYSLKTSNTAAATRQLVHCAAAPLNSEAVCISGWLPEAGVCVTLGSEHYIPQCDARAPKSILFLLQ